MCGGSRHNTSLLPRSSNPVAGADHDNVAAVDLVSPTFSVILLIGWSGSGLHRQPVDQLLGHLVGLVEADVQKHYRCHRRG